MKYQYKSIRAQVHRLIPSRFPPVSMFDWAESSEELSEIAALEGMTNERLQTEYGSLYLVSSQDWVSGEGSTPLMAAFTHPGPSRFSDGSFGIYYAANSLQTAISETRFHREYFLKASNEPPCLVQMREYIARVQKPLVDIHHPKFNSYLNPDMRYYEHSQQLGYEIKMANEWGIAYPSVRNQEGYCVAILRPPALTLPKQGCHLDYIWDGEKISDIMHAKTIA